MLRENNYQSRIRSTENNDKNNVQDRTMVITVKVL